MKRMPLETLRRLREQELSLVEQAFADAVHRETMAEEALQRHELNLAREQALACDVTADDEMVEAFSRWLPIGRDAVAQAQSLCRQAAADKDDIRAALLMARAALEAVEALEETQQEEVRKTVLRKEQAVLDELAIRGNRFL